MRFCLLGVVPLLLAVLSDARLLRADSLETRATAPQPLEDLQKPHRVRLVYFVPQDRQPTPNYAAKIKVLMSFVNDLFLRDLTAQGYSTRGLDFEFAEGELVVHLLSGQENTVHYNGAPNYDMQAQWRAIGPEVERALGTARDNLYIVLAETYDDGPAAWEWPGGLALGAHISSRGGMGIFSAWILRDEFCATTIEEQLKFFADSTPIPGRIAHGHGQMNSPRFEFIEDGFGAVAHELGHAIGLPHDLRDDSRFIMGNGFRRLRTNYLGPAGASPRVGFSPDNARLLAHSRFLAEAPDLDDETPVTFSFTFPTQLTSGSTKFSLKVEAQQAGQLAAVLFRDLSRDTVIGGGDVAAEERGTVTEIEVPPLAAGELRLEAVGIDRGGNISRAAGTVKVVPPAEPPVKD